jgi:Holliday junction DNA helicase RuvB
MNIVRPTTLDDYIATDNIKNLIRVAVTSSMKRKAHLDHILITGGPGTGKTTLVDVIGNERGVKVHHVLATTITNDQILMLKILQCKENEILFIDEVHNLPEKICELLYSVMEDGKLMMKLGPNTVNHVLKGLTIIAATTDIGELVKPFIDRFQLHINLNFYTYKDLIQILNANLSCVTLTDEAKLYIAQVSRGTPRICIQHLHHICNYAISEELKHMERSHVESAFNLIGVDHSGLTNIDREILVIMASTFNMQPVGIDAIASTLGISRTTIERQNEPFLVRENYIIRTKGGRVLSPKAVEYLSLMNLI